MDFTVRKATEQWRLSSSIQRKISRSLTYKEGVESKARHCTAGVAIQTHCKRGRRIRVFLTLLNISTSCRGTAPSANAAPQTTDSASFCFSFVCCSTMLFSQNKVRLSAVVLGTRFGRVKRRGKRKRHRQNRGTMKKGTPSR